MITTNKIRVNHVHHSRLQETDLHKIDFGKTVSDHMLVAHYTNGTWQEPQIVPYAHLSLAPVSLALHYGQTVFEGMKAFRMHDGRVSIFRIEKHYDRLCKSLERMCMPAVPYELFTEGIKQLVETDAGWVPETEGAALYIRPFVFASNEERFGVHESAEYTFVIFTGPVGPYYSQPVRVKVEDHFVRAAQGGTGYAKCGGNYGGSFYPTKLARQQGFDQVLWTDAEQHEYIEESGTMNVMFAIDSSLVTPPLSGTILDGVTRDSLLTIAHDLGLTVEERKVSCTELEAAFKAGKKIEAFGVGTAAVVSPIGLIDIKGRQYQLQVSPEAILYKLKNELEAMRRGIKKDSHHWNTIVSKHDHI
jgi:branched-chain amino acid aminotransferase